MAGKRKEVEETSEEPQEITVEEAFGEDPPITEKKVVVDGMLDQALKDETSATSEPEPQAQTVTREEFETLKQMLGEKDKAYQGLQKVINRKDSEINKLKKQTPQTGNQTLQELLELVGGDDMDVARTGKIERLKAQLARETQLQQQDRITADTRDALDQRIYDAGLDPNDAMFDGVNDAFELAANVSGNFQTAERRLDRILAQTKRVETKVETQVESNESEEDRIERLAEERTLQKLKEKGLLKTETGGPSASSGSFVEKEKRYIKGNLSREEYEKAARSEGKLH
jgi:hypothetical protein